MYPPYFTATLKRTLKIEQAVTPIKVPINPFFLEMDFSINLSFVIIFFIFFPFISSFYLGLTGNPYFIQFYDL